MIKKGTILVRTRGINPNIKDQISGYIFSCLKDNNGGYAYYRQNCSTGHYRIATKEEKRMVFI